MNKENLQNLKKHLVEVTQKNLDPLDLLQYLKNLGLTKECAAYYAQFDSENYTRNLICKTDKFEMILLCWEPGQETMIHDHASQGCWMTVLEGVITSENFKYISPKEFSGKLEKASTQSFKAGQSYYIDDTMYLHLLRNPVKSSVRSMTLHIYAKPFSSCTVYDLDKRETRELKLMYHSVNGDKGLWAASSVTSVQ